MMGAALTERELALSAPVRHLAFHRKVEAAAAALLLAKLKAADDSQAAALDAAVGAPAPEEPLLPPMKKPWFEIVAIVGPPSMAQIKQAVCEHYRAEARELVSGRRTHNIIIPRQVAMFLCRRLTEFTMPAIGNAFGGRDHTTIIHACRKINQLLAEQSGTIGQDIAAICSGLGCEAPEAVEMQRASAARSDSSDAELMRLWGLGFSTADIARKTRRQECKVSARVSAMLEAARDAG